MSCLSRPCIAPLDFQVKEQLKWKTLPFKQYTIQYSFSLKEWCFNSRESPMLRHFYDSTSPLKIAIQTDSARSAEKTVWPLRQKIRNMRGDGTREWTGHRVTRNWAPLTVSLTIQLTVLRCTVENMMPYRSKTHPTQSSWTKGGRFHRENCT